MVKHLELLTTNPKPVKLGYGDVMGEIIVLLLKAGDDLTKRCHHLWQSFASSLACYLLK